MKPSFFYPSKKNILEVFDNINMPKIISKNTALSSMGSCFATNIGRFFIDNGYNYLIKESLKHNQNQKGLNPYIAASARWDFVYNSSIMRQIFEYTFTDTWKPLVRWWELKSGIVTDPYRRGAEYRRGSAYKEFEKHRAASRSALSECEVFIFTLGLTELWRDSRDKMVYYRIPASKIYDSKIHEFYIQNVENVLFDLDFVYNILKENNKDIKFIATVSPVPFNASFRNDIDVVSANIVSKSILRVAVDEFVKNYSDVYYFPSYELVIMANIDPFVGDARHVKPQTVSAIMEIFEKNYCLR